MKIQYGFQRDKPRNKEKLVEAAKSCQKITEMFDTKIVMDLGMDIDIDGSKEVEGMEVLNTNKPTLPII